MRVNIDHSEGVHVTASSPKVFQVYILQEVFVRQSCVVTRSDLMRVSHSGTANLKIQNFKIFFTYIGALYVENIWLRISFVGTLHTRISPPCKSEGMGMLTVATLVCQIWG